MGRCPLGGCSKHGQDLGKGYEDDGACARRKVWNHLRNSPQQAGHFNSDEDVSDCIDSDVSAWLSVSTQKWTQDEFDQWMAENADRDEAEAGQAVPEPTGLPGKGKGKDKGKGKGIRTSTSSQPRPRTVFEGGGLDRKLEDQIRRQTQNMLHSTRAASTYIDALRVAADMSRQAAAAFEQQRLAMEEGMEEMIDAFGLEPQQRRRRSARNQLDPSTGNMQIDLARQVRRASPHS